jgi:hypothetical protein
MRAESLVKGLLRHGIDDGERGSIKLVVLIQPIDELIRQDLGARNDPRKVVADPHARHFGAELGERSLIPAADARLGGIRFQEWLTRPVPQR